LYRGISDTLNSELNPICHPLALLEAHRIPHISRIRAKKGYRLRTNIVKDDNGDMFADCHSILAR